ncbi:hypothetical protein HK102_013448 [Quaeritorhiza haematococci]|nr:hypothetical protein HK102_013448 [Quaeritorhiza haematococci]
MRKVFKSKAISFFVAALAAHAAISAFAADPTPDDDVDDRDIPDTFEDIEPNADENADGLFGDIRGPVQPGDIVTMDDTYPGLGFVASGGVMENEGRARAQISEGDEDDDWKMQIGRLARAFGAKKKKEFKFVFNRLPKSGKVSRIPWPGDYWPTYRDSVNMRWAGENTLSPIEKYAKAFNMDSAQLSNMVSSLRGIDSMWGRPECKTNDQCKSLNDGSVCSKRRGQDTGRCIPGWFGICHAWAPAAIFEKEPKCSVTHNGVEFNIMDLKAIMTLIYDQASLSTVFGGRRCNSVRPQVDGYGRYGDLPCRDLNPGFFHLVLTNMIGRYDTSFVIDKDALAAVWNQPIRSFRVLEHREMSPEDVMRKFYSKNEAYPFTKTTDPSNPIKLIYVKTKVKWIVEARDDRHLTGNIFNRPVNAYTKRTDLEYILEVETKEGRIVGGEWVGASKQDHPDFLYVPVDKAGEDTEIGGMIKYSDFAPLWKKATSKRHCFFS